MKTLRKGSKGPDVRTLQKKLTAAGHSLNPIDENFGPKTDTALRNFQRQHQLTADGVAGSRTWDALDAAIKEIERKKTIKTIRKNSRGPLVRTLQEKLSAAGYPVKPLSEYFGPITDTAVRNFQRKNKLLADGVVGANTWRALSDAASTKLVEKPINSSDNLVASLGSVGVLSAAIASAAPTSSEVAKPVSHLKTSVKGLQFLYSREAWKGVSNRLHWPGGASGVTLGPGYDMKERSEAAIAQDMIKIGVSADTAKSIAKAAGLSGLKAKEFCKVNRDLVSLSDKVEFKLMKIIIPKYERLARKKIKIDLLPHEFDALVSFAYNLGQVWTSIANHLNAGKVNDAMTRMKAANKSGGKINAGLTKRRSLEIALYLFGNYGALRAV